MPADLAKAALVYVNTLMIQDLLADPQWADALTAEDRRGLTHCSGHTSCPTARSS